MAEAFAAPDEKFEQNFGFKKPKKFEQVIFYCRVFPDHIAINMDFVSALIITSIVGQAVGDGVRGGSPRWLQKRQELQGELVGVVPSHPSISRPLDFMFTCP